MKKLLLLSILITSLNALAQPCNGGRYATEIFSTVDITSDIAYGSNTTFTGASQQLNLDVYEPSGDVETARPLIVWAHGGSFIGGSKTDGDVVALSNSFAKKGYVCASIDYRLGMWPIDSTNAIKALLRSVQDMKAAVRYFYKDAQTSNTFKIDTTKIFIGGSSAGAILSLHYAYLDKVCEAEEYLSISTLNQLGGLEGESGNPGYSTDVIGVVNLCGAFARYGYLEAGDIPLCSMHGDNDGTVPYNHGMANVSGFDVLNLDGSRMIEEQANAVGVTHNFYTYYGAGHVPYAGNASYADTTDKFIRDFLIQTMGCSDPALLAENTPLEEANLYQLTYCGLSIKEDENQNFVVSPNPSNGDFEISWNEGTQMNSIEIISTNGQVIKYYTINSQSNSFQIDNLDRGIYLIRVKSADDSTNTKRIVIQ